MKSKMPHGSESEITKWETEAIRLFLMPYFYAGLILLLIAFTIILLPEMQANTKDFLMVAFACVAFLPER